MKSIHPRLAFLFWLMAGIAGAAYPPPGPHQTTVGLWHAIRYDGGNWQKFRDAGDINGALDLPMLDFQVAGTPDKLHLIALPPSRDLLHTIRYSGGSWQGYRVAPPPPESPRRVYMAGVGEAVHIVILTAEGRLWHTIRRPSGKWDGWGDLMRETDLDLWTFEVTAVALAGSGDELHLLALTPFEGLFHTVRRPGGNWQTARRINLAAILPGESVEEMALAGTPEGDTHLVLLTRQGNLYHTIRFAGGSWQSWNEMRNVLNARDQPLCGIALAGTTFYPEDSEEEDPDAEEEFPASTGIHLMALTPGGIVLHSKRYPDGRWQSLGNVGQVAGANGTAHRLVGAGVGLDLHLVASGPLVIPTYDPKVNNGDVNGDRRIAVDDAVLALRFATGLELPNKEKKRRADVVTDGSLDVRDVIQILRMVVEGNAPG